MPAPPHATPPLPRPAARGVTLVELLVGMAVLGVLLAVGVPSFNGMLGRWRQQAAIDTFVADIQLARSTANALDGAGRPAFDIDGDGRLEPMSMVYMPAGGFNANIGVVFRNADNSLTRDFMSQLNAGLLGEAPAIAAPDRGVRITITGTTPEPVNAGRDPGDPNDDDPLGTSRPWSRQQYQLSRPPQ